MPGSIVFNRFVAPLNPSVRLFTKHPRWDSNPKPSAPEADLDPDPGPRIGVFRTVSPLSTRLLRGVYPVSRTTFRTTFRVTLTASVLGVEVRTRISAILAPPPRKETADLPHPVCS